VRPLLQTREYLRRASRVNKRTGNAAIKSTEHYADAKETVERSKQLKRQADDLIESSRQLVDSSKRRSGKHGKPEGFQNAGSCCGAVVFRGSVGRVGHGA
jgi:hypothetical protein